MQLFKPLTPCSCREWAENHRYIAPGTSPEAGKWKTDRVPFMSDILETISDPAVSDIVLMCSSQIGKSELLLNALCYYIAQEPSPILFLQPTIEAAESFSKERIEPTLQVCPLLSGKFEQGQNGRGSSRKSSETIRLKKFPGGFLAMVGANSPAGLASRPIRILLCDEVDRYGVTKEGDPLKLAEQRTLNFFNAKRLFVSTPTIKGASKIEDKFLLSDQRFFLVPCPHCEEYQELTWQAVVWDKTEDNRPILDSSKLICTKCGKTIRGAGKISRDILARGIWKSKNKHNKTGCIGFSLNALYSPWVDLSQLVEEFCNSVATRKGLQEFVNLKLGLPFNPANYADEWKEAFERCELYGDA
ncbi:MAG: terminase gpA endonuclease subunit, partial [Oscillospiraceae bacterium]